MTNQNFHHTPVEADIDIDFKDRDRAISVLPGLTYATIEVTDCKVVRTHNTGVYFTKIPKDNITNAATIDYKEAATRGYFKLDFLNLGIYELIESEQHLNDLIELEANWTRLHTDKEFVSKIIHIGNYFELLQSMKPSNINELAMFLAVIRPGKADLRNKPWDIVEKTVWDLTNATGYTFKHAHAISYAMAVKVHMNLIEEQEVLRLLNESN